MLLHRSAWIRLCLQIGLVFALAAGLSNSATSSHSQSEGEDLDVALGLAGFLRSARAVHSANQDLINNPSIGEKGLSGEVVLERVTAGVSGMRHVAMPVEEPATALNTAARYLHLGWARLILDMD